MATTWYARVKPNLGTNVNVRTAPSIAGVACGLKSPGEFFTISSNNYGKESMGGTIREWAEIEKGKRYICYSETKNGNTNTYLEVVGRSGNQADFPPPSWTSSGTSSNKKGGVTTVKTTQEQNSSTFYQNQELEIQQNTGILEANPGYTPSGDAISRFDKTWDTETEGTEFFDINSVLGVFGLPYQFMPSVDPRLSASGNQSIKGDSRIGRDYGDTAGIGAKYAEQIVANMPILFMSPGKPNFMGKFSKNEKKSVLGNLLSIVGGVLDNSEDTLDDLIENGGKYYTFEYTPEEYYKYVNPMCRIAAAFMDITNYTLDGVHLDSVNWRSYTSSKLSGIFKGAAPVDFLSIPFYIESETQISDTFSNDLTDSTLASTVNSVSDSARELQFLLGYSGSVTGIDKLLTDPDVASNVENLNNMIRDLMKGRNNSFLGNLGNHLLSVATGGKMMFPKIWSGSDFSRSYDITIKLRSPDMDNLSLYFNIVVPTMHLIGFVAPHIIQQDPNSYGNPFIVRCMYKGFFNIDMGLITSMSISKGDQGQWNANGVPSTLDVNFTVVDLYEAMGISKTDSTNWKYDTLNNTAEMDYIANFCGINVYKPEIGRTIAMWFVNNFTNRARDFVPINMWGNIRTSVMNAIVNTFVRIQ